MKLVPVSVMLLLRYAALGEMLSLNVGTSSTLKETPLVETTADGGLLILTSTPTAPTLVLLPATTTIVVFDTIAHDDAAAPAAGVGPTRALHV
jgi:hypothetical protein